jgi:hypothetical protein
MNITNYVATTFKYEIPGTVFSSLTSQNQLQFYLKIVYFKKSSVGSMIPHGRPQLEDHCFT